jgi:hypothetical protein
MWDTRREEGLLCHSHAHWEEPYPWTTQLWNCVQGVGTGLQENTLSEPFCFLTKEDGTGFSLGLQSVAIEQQKKEVVCRRWLRLAKSTKHYD